ncbi:MAG: ester cyclase [Solirubrobacterales bacterium]|nr:ester cyclase [Solirubrobacterales bacterium]OJU94941.1 MAG: polyketide cyclase [Solirubrobacterales bacterium 67-14]
MLTEEVKASREKVVLDHFADEVAQDWDATLSTFPHPRYELIPTETVHDGDSAVRGYYHDTRVAFPDQRHEMIALRHSDDAVIVEFYLLGTHLGPLGPVPPTGGKFKVRMTAFFVFDEANELVTERVYFDQLTMMRQLLKAVNLKSPSGLVKMAKILRGFAKLGKEPKDEIPALPARSSNGS